MPIQRITSGILADGAIVATDIADGSVTTSKLADANVTTSKLADANVTSSKLASTLSISGNFLANNVTANTNLIVPAGSNTAPSIFPSGDTNTGIFFPAADTIAFAEGGAEAMRMDANGNIGIGTTTPLEKLDVRNDNVSFGTNGTSGNVHIVSGLDGSNKYVTRLRTDYNSFFSISTGSVANATAPSAGSLTERARIDSNGNLLVGKTTTATADIGMVIGATGFGTFTRDGFSPLNLNRKTSDGDIATFIKDGTTVGVIGCNNSRLYIGSGDTGLDFEASTDAVRPMNTTTGAGRDNAIDLGRPDVRFRDAYITDGVTTGSDRNDKQDIEELSEAETRVAVACKGLLRKWRWKEAVAEKGDDARIHFGIIAQDLKAAFEAEGLDAGRYAMFIHSAWWEKERVIPAVEADEENDIEAKEAYTRIDTYQTEAEAPEGAVRKERMGIRYNELLAFMVAAL